MAGKKKENPFLYDGTTRTHWEDNADNVHVFLHDAGKQKDWDDEMDANCRELAPEEQAFYDRQKAMGLTFVKEGPTLEDEFFTIQIEHFTPEKVIT